jgi:GNAT superfamily N-acetyltransferase
MRTKKKKKIRKKTRKRYGGAASGRKINIRDFNIRDLDIIFEQKNDHTYVTASYEGNVVGTAHLYTFEDEITLENFQVIPEVRGKGIGTKMLQSMIENAFDKNVHKDKIIHKVVLTDLTGSEQYNPTKTPNDMYQKAGFVCSKPGIAYCKNDLELTRERYEKLQSNRNPSPNSPTRKRSRNPNCSQYRNSKR